MSLGYSNSWDDGDSPRPGERPEDWRDGEAQRRADVAYTAWLDGRRREYERREVEGHADAIP